MKPVARQGDFTETHAQAIVNAGNTSLWLGSGVAGAIRVKGGPSIQKELDDISGCRLFSPRRIVRTAQDVTYDFPCELGEVVVTSAGNLKASVVLHAAVMDCMGPHKAVTGPSVIRVATRNCLLQARQLGMYGIAFPLFGTGVGGMDVTDVAQIMVDTILNAPPSDMLIRIYGYTEADYKAVQAVLSNTNSNV